jgi:hypothetical protein
MVFDGGTNKEELEGEGPTTAKVRGDKEVRTIIAGT